MTQMGQIKFFSCWFNVPTFVPADRTLRFTTRILMLATGRVNMFLFSSGQNESLDFHLIKKLQFAFGAQ
jgi:hypothetical protein